MTPQRCSIFAIPVSGQGRALLLSELRPHFWRAPVDNDLGWAMPLKLRMWRAASSHRKQALLQFRLLRHEPRGACLLSSWRVASAHLHRSRLRSSLMIPWMSLDEP